MPVFQWRAASRSSQEIGLERRSMMTQGRSELTGRKTSYCSCVRSPVPWATPEGVAAEQASQGRSARAENLPWEKSLRNTEAGRMESLGCLVV
ncbi:UNVERIFIED_CONTAM: hypothetical protein K2H54_057764 [Gekko kuhli]